MDENSMVVGNVIINSKDKNFMEQLLWKKRYKRLEEIQFQKQKMCLSMMSYKIPWA